MSDGIRTESLRNEAVKTQLELKHDKEMKDLKAKQKNEVNRVVEQNAMVKSDLENAYQIQFSHQKEEFDKRMAEIRTSNEKTLEEEKSAGEAEVEKTRARYQEQIARYRENSEKYLTDLRRKTDNSAELIKKSREKGKA